MGWSGIELPLLQVFERADVATCCRAINGSAGRAPNLFGRACDPLVQSRARGQRASRALNACARERHKLKRCMARREIGMQHEKIIRAMFMGHEIIARNFWSAT
jgi:hypothetical protein